MDPKGIRLGDNFSVDDSGNVTIAGTVTATGNIGGFDINSVELRKDIFDSNHWVIQIELDSIF